MRHFEIEQSSAKSCSVVLLSQERRFVVMSNGSSTVMTSTSSDFLMSASRHSSFLCVLSSSVALLYSGITANNQLHYRTSVTSQQGAPSQRYYRNIYGEIRGITAVTAVLPTSLLPSSVHASDELTCRRVRVLRAL